MLRLTIRGSYLGRINNALRTINSVAGDGETLGTAVDVAQAFMKEHQITIAGAKLDQYKPAFSFNDVAFAPKIKAVLAREKFENPSPIQALSWPIALGNRDMISVAKTGSGKTLGFLLPGFNQILNKPAQAPSAGTRRRTFYKRPHVLVLSPTRELGMQTAAEADKYRAAGIRTVCVYGGASRMQQMNALREGADCVVATPGRCNDLISDGALDLSDVKYLVLDEADRMLDMGFEPQIRQVIDQLPRAQEGRQTLFFTATWPREVQSLARQFLNDPVHVSIGQQDALNANKDIRQHVMVVKAFHKRDALFDILEQRILPSPDSNPTTLPKTLIFVKSKDSADDLCGELRHAGYRAGVLHGGKSQAVRDDVMHNFRSGRINVLLATDIAARGLDVKDVANVINFDFPGQTEDYVHRIGRTGRAGQSGDAYTLLTAQDMTNNRNMSDLVGVLSRAGQEVPAPLEPFRKGGSQHSEADRGQLGMRKRDSSPAFGGSWSGAGGYGGGRGGGGDRRFSGDRRGGGGFGGGRGGGRGGGGFGGAGFGGRDDFEGGYGGSYSRGGGDREGAYGMSSASPGFGGPVRGGHGSPFSDDPSPSPRGGNPFTSRGTGAGFGGDGYARKAPRFDEDADFPFSERNDLNSVRKTQRDEYRK